MSFELPEADRSFAKPAADHQIETTRTSLEGRNLSVHVVDTVATARALLGDLLPAEEEIFTVSSQTLQLSGIAGGGLRPGERDRQAPRDTPRGDPRPDHGDHHPRADRFLTMTPASAAIRSGSPANRMRPGAGQEACNPGLPHPSKRRAGCRV